MIAGWKLEVHLLDIMTRARQTIVVEREEQPDMVVQLAQLDARFVYEGITYWGSRPTVDPINRVITYWCEGCKDAS